MSYLPGKFIWFEHISNDVPTARKFYGELFGWSSDPLPMGAEAYHMIQNKGQGIGGFRTAMPGMPTHWMSYLSVPDVDASVRAALAAGAKVLMPPTDFAPIGRGATIADPTGAVFSVWKSVEGDPPDVERVPPGGWYWNECCTRDTGAALAFYEKVFGYTHEAMTLDPQNPYYVLKKDGVARAGLMRVPDPAAPAAWMPYVAVTDCDATAERAKALGAQICVAPRDIPDVGRFTVLMDPTGAVIAAIRGMLTA